MRVRGAGEGRRAEATQLRRRQIDVGAGARGGGGGRDRWRLRLHRYGGGKRRTTSPWGAGGRGLSPYAAEEKTNERSRAMRTPEIGRRCWISGAGWCGKWQAGCRHVQNENVLQFSDYFKVCTRAETLKGVMNDREREERGMHHTKNHKTGSRG